VLLLWFFVFFKLVSRSVSSPLGALSLGSGMSVPIFGTLFRLLKGVFVPFPWSSCCFCYLFWISLPELTFL